MTALAFQLYSARNFPLGDTLNLLARLGYGGVEGYGGTLHDSAGLAGLWPVFVEPSPWIDGGAVI